ncbi:MAG: DNA-binding protein [Desulfobulbaceae bacterium]|nr:DNA-binding protein [Desulfobulbaceae bacterium]
MDYRSGTVGRVFAVRFDDGDDFLAELNKLIIKENIRSGWFHVIGGMREAGVVTGPQKPVMPPEPVWAELDTVRETLGTGTIFWDDTEPKIHLHAALGHHGDTITACVRKGTKVYLVLEVFIIETVGINAGRPWYEAGGFNRLTFS